MAFEEFGKKLQQLGQETVTSVQRMGEAVQAGSRLSEAKRELTKAYASLGSAMIEKFEEAPEGMEELYAAVRSAKENVASCEKIVARVKGVVICPECGREAAKGEKYCSSCGAKLPAQEEETEETAEPLADAYYEPVDETDADDPDDAGFDEDTAVEEDAGAVNDAAAENAEEAKDADTAEDAGAVTAADTAEDAGNVKNVEQAEDAEAAKDAEQSEAAEDVQGAAASKKVVNLDIDTEKLVEDMKQAGQAAGDVLNEAADKARELLGNFTGKAGTFMSGLSNKLSEKSAKSAEDTVSAEDIAAAVDDTDPETAVQPDSGAASENTAETPEETAEATAEETAEATVKEAAAEGLDAAAEEALQSAEALAEKIQESVMDAFDEKPEE